jgi:hypothetical protein
MAQCLPAQLQLARGPVVSPATGQHPYVFRLENRSRASCLLKGYPSVALLDARGHARPFVISHRGDQMVTPALPKVVRLRPGRSAFFMLNKYRCDLGFASTQRIRQLRIGLPAEPRAMRLKIALPRWPQIGYCGRGDAGSVVTVSRIASTVAGVSRH